LHRKTVAWIKREKMGQHFLNEVHSQPQFKPRDHPHVLLLPKFVQIKKNSLFILIFCIFIFIKNGLYQCLHHINNSY
jgi:hypothetical protein